MSSFFVHLAGLCSDTTRLRDAPTESKNQKVLTVEYRAVSGVFQTIDPPPPFPQRVWKTPDIELASYSIIPLRWELQRINGPWKLKISCALSRGCMQIVQSVLLGGTTEYPIHTLSYAIPSRKTAHPKKGNSPMTGSVQCTWHPASIRKKSTVVQYYTTFLEPASYELCQSTPSLKYPSVSSQARIKSCRALPLWGTQSYPVPPLSHIRMTLKKVPALPIPTALLPPPT
jgi:hypothetical protein